jgi:hypothetical protein
MTYPVVWLDEQEMARADGLPRTNTQIALALTAHQSILSDELPVRQMVLIALGKCQDRLMYCR